MRLNDSEVSTDNVFKDILAKLRADKIGSQKESEVAIQKYIQVNFIYPW